RFRAVGGKVVERLLESLGLTNNAVHRSDTRIDRAVEDQGAHTLRVGLRVLSTQLRSVRKAHVCQLVVAKGRPNCLRVFDSRGGADVLQELLARPVSAPLHESL